MSEEQKNLENNQMVEVSAETEVAASSKKGKKWVIPAVIAVAAVAAVAYVALTYVNPKDAVIDAFKSITAEGQTNPMEDIFGVQMFAADRAVKSVEGSLGVTFEGSSLEGTEMLSGAGIDMDLYRDMESKQFSVDMGINFADMDLATIQVYMDENQIMAAVPELVSKAFVLNYADDLEGQLAASTYVGPMLEESGIDLIGIGNYMDQCMELAEKETKLFDLNALWNRYKEGSEAMDALKEAMTAEKIEKKEFTIDGEVMNCKGYHVTVTKDAMVQFAKTTKDFFLADETLKNDMIFYMDLMAEMQNSIAAAELGSSMQSGAEMQKEIWTNAETEIDELIAWMEESMGDVSANVYVRKDGKIAGFDFDTAYLQAEENVKLDGDVTFGGGYHMLANVDAVLNRESASGDVAALTIKTSGNYEAGIALNNGLTLAVDAEDSAVEIEMDWEYQIADGSLSAEISMNDSETQIMTITADGFVENLVKGESFDCILDYIKIQSPEMGAEDAYIELSADYSVAPLAETVEKPDGEMFDILSGTEEDYSAVVEEVYGNIFGLIMQMYQ